MLLVVAMLFCAAAEPTPIERILVLDLAASGVDGTVARNLSEVFALSVRKAKAGITVVGQADIAAMLALERQRDLVSCEGNVSCLAEIGGALGADHLAVGTVGKVGDVHVVTLKLIDSKRALPVRHLSEEAPGSEASLVEAVRQLGAHLVDPEKLFGLGFIDVGGTGEVMLDGVPLGKAPVARHPVAAGVHTVRWADGTELGVQVDAYALTRAVPEALGETRTAWPRSRAWTIDLAPQLSYVVNGPKVEKGESDFGGFALRAGWVSKDRLFLFGSANWRQLAFQVEQGGGVAPTTLDSLGLSIGVGYLFGDALRFLPAVSVDAARELDNGAGYEATSAASIGLSAGDIFFGITPRADVRYRVLDWLELGVGLDFPLAFAPGGVVMGLLVRPHVAIAGG